MLAQACWLLPAHNAHLGGLVLLPLSLSSLADAPLVRAILQRRLFERTGYTGPHRVEPPRSAWTPKPWPETVVLSVAVEGHVISRLKSYRRTRPQYYQKWRPGGPGRPPRHA